MGRLYKQTELFKRLTLDVRELVTARSCTAPAATHASDILLIPEGFKAFTGKVRRNICLSLFPCKSSFHIERTHKKYKTFPRVHPNKKGPQEALKL